MEFTVCNTPEQLELAQRLRYEVFCLEKSWVDATECEGGREADPSDEIAAHFLALEDGVAVGTVRYLLGWQQELPAVSHLDLSHLDHDPSKIVEVSRLATTQTKRSHNMRIFLGLTVLMWEWAMEREVPMWLAIADVPLYHMLTRIGLPVVAEGERFEYLGSMCVPVAFDMPGTGPVLKGARR